MAVRGLVKGEKEGFSAENIDYSSLLLINFGKFFDFKRFWLSLQS